MKNKIILILCIFILISFNIINISFAAVSTDDLISTEPVNTYFYTAISELRNTYPEEDYYYTYGYAYGPRVYQLIFFEKKYVTITPYIFYSGFTHQDNDYYNIKIGNDNDNVVAHVYKIYDGFYQLDNTYTYQGAVPGFTNYTYSTVPIQYSADFTVYTNSSLSKVFYSFYEEPTIIYPAISNTAEDLSTGMFDYILVSPGTFSNTENIGLNIYNITNLEENGDAYSQKSIFSTVLNSSSSFYNAIVVEDQTEFWFEIPRANLNIDFKNDNTYLYSLILDGSPIQEIQATICGLTEEDILNNNFDNLQSAITDSNKELQSSIDKQTQAIEENNKTNKNIFEKIGEILSYLNPFSENFFAYKLVELIVDGLKSLFIPADDFFSLYFDELNNWFSDRLGFLYYPLELLFDLLDRFLNINFAEPIINIPNIKEPFTNVTLIKSTSFNFNDLLENETLKNVHDIYFIIVDAVIYIGLVSLLYKKYEEVMTK